MAAATAAAATTNETNVMMNTEKAAKRKTKRRNVLEREFKVLFIAPIKLCNTDFLMSWNEPKPNVGSPLPHMINQLCAKTRNNFRMTTVTVFTQSLVFAISRLSSTLCRQPNASVCVCVGPGFCLSAISAF